MLVLESHFIAVKQPGTDQFNWTMPTRLGHMLDEAETRYGRRDLSWTILGVEFGGDVPHIWFPFDRGHVAVRLTTSALYCERQACYQLAHEVIHLLAPVLSGRAPVLEEGLATLYSEDFVLRQFNTIGMTDTQSYTRAASLAQELLAEVPDAIPRLRAIEPYFSRMTAVTFASAGIAVRDALISELLSPFVRE